MKHQHPTAADGTGSTSPGRCRVATLAVSLALAPLAKPLLRVERFVAYQAALGMQPGTAERHAMGRLPQFFADRLGWRELAETVAQAHRALPDDERSKVCVFGQNYGQAGAIDFYGPALGLPKAISSHNSYHVWGPGDCTGEVLLMIGDEREDLRAGLRERRAGRHLPLRRLHALRGREVDLDLPQRAHAAARALAADRALQLTPVLGGIGDLRPKARPEASPRASDPRRTVQYASGPRPYGRPISQASPPSRYDPS